MDITLPKAQNRPPLTLQGLVAANVPRAVLGHLGLPALFVGTTKKIGAVLWTPMPEAAVNQDRHTVARKGEVDTEPFGQSLVQSETQP